MKQKMPSTKSSASASWTDARLKKDALAIFKASLKAADPYAATLRHLRAVPDNVRRLYVVGAGKASANMARAVEKFYGKRIHGGVIVTKHGHGLPLRRIQCLEASHPMPNREGVEGARRIAELCMEATEEDLILCLISGGASALLPFPAPPITLDEKQETTKLLLSCGADIHELNAVRKHLSAIKGGQLAHLAYPARVETLILSDVIGDPLDVIGSGPTVPDTSTFADAWEILFKFRLERKLPAAVRERLKAGVNQEIPETPKPGDPIFSSVRNTLIGSNRLSVEAASREAKALGYNTLLLTTTLDGEAREIAKIFSAMAREVRASGHPLAPPAAILSGGETTVNLSLHHGLGGRNQEMALEAATGIAGLERTLFLAAGTDGTDGPTNAAGAFAFGSTMARAGKLEMNAVEYLSRNDSYHYFQPLGDLLLTGPTGTNVMDIHLLLLR
jgi:glycerate 2-kinase